MAKCIGQGAGLAINVSHIQISASALSNSTLGQLFMHMFMFMQCFLLSFRLTVEWLRERTEHLDIFLFSAHQ